MTTTEQNKLKHDLLNSIVIINNMTKSATNFFNLRAEAVAGEEDDQKQKEKFSYCMHAIREQTAKIEEYFEKLLKEL